MSEKNNVFITSKGKKYHFYSSCNYLKGRKYQIIPLAQIKNKAKGPCTTCQRLYNKNGKGKNSDDLIKEEDIIEVLKESKNNIDMDNIKMNKEINNINNKKNNILPFIKEKKIINEKRLEKNKSSNSSSSDSYNEDKKNNKINEKENDKENFLPFNLDEISGIKSNVHNIDSKLDIDLKKENNNILNKNIINNNINNNKKEMNNEIISDNEEEEEEDEKEENNNINNINNNKIKEEYELFLNNNNKNSLENMKQLKYNLDPNLPKKDLNWTGKDINILIETNTKSKLFFLQEMGQITNPNGKKIVFFSKKATNKNDNTINNGNFKFKFNIIPKKELKEPLEISVGFEIDFLEENTLMKKENKKIKLICDTLSLIKNFFVYKETNKVYVLINIPNGKFFVIGNDELEKRNKRVFLNSENTDILYLKNFPPINQENIKDVRPIFKYDITYQKFANIEA